MLFYRNTPSNQLKFDIRIITFNMLLSIDRRNKSYYTAKCIIVDSEDICEKMKNRNRKNNLHNTAILMLVFVLLGVVVSVQVKSVAKEKSKASAEEQSQIAIYKEKIEELQVKLAENEAKHDLLSATYEAEMEQLYVSDKQFYELYKKYETEINEHKFAAGLTTVTGAGIDIGLDDAQKKYDSAPALLVHDIYLNEIINTLRAAGAQAIAVNGERIVSMSETLCMGPSIRINNTKLFAPYHIEAIGDPQALLSAFKSSAIYETIIKDNLIVDPVIKDKITIKRYSKSYETSIELLSEYK